MKKKRVTKPEKKKQSKPKPKSKKIKVEEKEEEHKEKDFMKSQVWYKRFWDRWFPGNTFLINMELRNGMNSTFMISTSKRNFKYKGGSYIIDESLKYYNISSKVYMLDYHQDFSLPIKRKIPVGELNKVIKASEIVETELSTNPTVLEDFINSKIAEGVMKGQAIDQFLKGIKLWIIAGTIVAVVHLALFLHASGMLENVKMPF